MRFKIVAVIFALLLVSGESWGQTTITVGGGATVVSPNTPTATWTTPPTGVTFSNWSRGSGVIWGTAADAINGSGFNTASASASYTANKYYSFTITADATHTFTLNSIDWLTAISGSKTANFTIQYVNNGGSLTTFGTAAQTNSTTNTFSGSVIVAAGTTLTIYAIPYGGTLVAGTTVRLKNGSTVNLTSQLIGSTTPTISTTGTLSAVNTTYGTASLSPTSFNVSGADMTAGITVTPPAGYEVSQTVGGASGYAGSGTAITVGSSGTIASTPVYVRLASTATVAGSPYSGNIVLSSSGATTVNVPTVSSTISAKTLTVTSSAANNKTYDGTNAATITGTLAGIVNADDVTFTGTGTFASINVGTAIDVTSTSTLGGAKAGNYSLTQPTGLTANITTSTQTITFGTLPTKTINDASFALTGTSSSGLAVSYTSSNTAVATVSGSTVSIVGAGSSIITASQAGNSNYNAAVSVEQTLTVTNTPTVLAGWDFNGQNTGPATVIATTFNPGLVSTTGANNITRGAGAAASTANNSFRTTGFQNNGISTSNTDYFQITLQPVAGKTVSLSSIDAIFAGTNGFFASPGVSSQFAYSLDGSDFTLIGSPVQSTSLTMAQVVLTGVAALQNVVAGTTVTLRYYASGQTSTGGWGFISSTTGTNGLAINGTVAQVSGLATPVATAASNISGTSFDANWNAVSGATGYEVAVNAITSGSALATDLFISEYVEGSSNNKAIEIYNGTGSAVNLASYSLKKQTNGANAYADEFVLSGTLANGAVYILANSAANTSILTLATATSASGIMQFNGNDAIALFKSGVQIDEVGIFNQVAVWGENVTLIRKNSIVSPAVTYSASDWDSNVTDYILNLGSHSMSGVGSSSSAIAGSPFTVSGQSTSSLTITGLSSLSNYTYVVRATNGIVTTPYSNEIALSTVLNGTITVYSTSLSDFSYVNGSGPSAEHNFTVSATNLSTDIIVTPPTHFDISTSTGVAFTATNPITLIRDGSGIIALTPIYVRLKAGLAIGTYYNENITLATTGVTTQNIDCSGAVTLALWKGTTDTDWNTFTNWTGNQVPAADASVGFDASPVNDCVLDADRSVTDIFNATNYKLQTNGFKLNVKGNINLTNGAQIDASAVGSTVEFAGTTAQSIPSGMFVGNNVYNLTINNASNVLLNGTLNLKNTFTSMLGKLDAFTNSPTFVYAGTIAQSIGNEFLADKATNLTIDNATGVTVNTDFTVNTLLTINASKKLIIPTQKQMNVVGTITNNAGVSGIYIKSSATVANGSLIYHNAYESPVKATVEMYSVASKPTTSYKWQFFGIPLRSMSASPTFNGSYVRQMHENDLPKHWEQLTSTANLTSFTGYEITQVSPKTFYFQGDLENKDFNSGVLAYTSSASNAGQHLIGNPYTAAIDITQLTFGDEVQASVYMYNTGSRADWTASGNGSSGNFAASPGQYISVPKELAGQFGILAQIPSMQSFLIVNSNTPSEVPGAHTFSIPYSAVVSKNEILQRAPSSNKTVQSDKVACVIDVKGSRYTDKLWIFTEPTCTRNYDNGWDGLKFLSATPSPQLFAMEADGDYQINAVDNINNTELGFQAGEDSQYTLTFTQNNLSARYNALYFLDLQENKTIDISESGTEYTFLASSTATPVKRFKIVTSPGVATAVSNNLNSESLKVFSSQKTIFVHNKSNDIGDLFIYDIGGQFIRKIPFSSNGITTLPMNLTVGSYLVKAITKSEEKTTSLILR